jgi:hypothetical protein
MPALFAVQEFYKGKTPQQLAASIPVDTSNPAAAVKQLQQQLALEKQAREVRRGGGRRFIECLARGRWQVWGKGWHKHFLTTAACWTGVRP